MNMLIVFLMNILVIGSSFLITYRRIKLENFIDSLGCWFLLYVAQIVLSELFLGACRSLTLPHLLAFNTLVLIGVWLVCKDRDSSWQASGAVAQGLALLNDKVMLLGFSLLTGFAAVKLAINAVNPPFGWDSLNYHFPFAVEWMKTGTLNVPMTVFDDPAPTYYPINGSLFFLWWLLPLQNVFLADLGQLPFFVLSGLMVYAISRKLGVAQKMSCVAALLCLLVPNFFKQLQIAYVDIMVAGLFLAGVNFLLLAARSYSAGHAACFALSVGLLSGTKIVALPYSFLLILPFAIVGMRNRTQALRMCAAGALIALLGGYSYIRNYLQTLNPLYPLQLELMGKVLCKGVIDRASYGSHFTSSDYGLVKLLFGEGLGVQTVLLTFPAGIFGWAWYGMHRRARPRLLVAYVLMLPLLMFLVFKYYIPLANVRYLYPALCMGMISAFVCIEFSPFLRRIATGLSAVCLIASTAELAKHQERMAGLALSLFLFLLIPVLVRRLAAHKRLRNAVVLLCVALLIPALVFLNQDYSRNEFKRYAAMVKYSGFWKEATIAWQWLDAHTQHNNIAYAGRPVSLPLYGSRFKNNVYYVSVNAIDPPKLHYYPGSWYHWDADFLNMHKSWEEPGNYRFGAEYQVWLNNLRAHRIDYLFVYSLHQVHKIIFPVEDAWAKAHPELFSLVYSNTIVHIYRLGSS